MFTWILIALIIAFIFGVIKIEQVKDLAKKYGPQARELFNKAKDTVEAKATEIKKTIDAKKLNQPQKTNQTKLLKLKKLQRLKIPKINKTFSIFTILLCFF